MLVDGSGDIACTDPSTLDSVQDIVKSRLKAALNGWQLYSFGADLQARVGDTIDPELDVNLRRQVCRAMTDDFLPRNAFDVRTLAFGDTIQVMVYLNNQVIAQATLSRTNPSDMVIQ